jgi:hypothetical protein
MKFCTYNSTPGLDRFPMEQRFRVWGNVHKELMGADAEYSRAVKRARFRIIASIVTFLIFNWVVTPLQRRIGNDTTLTILSIIITVAAIFAYLFFLLYESFRMQCFQNERIGRVLQSR